MILDGSNLDHAKEHVESYISITTDYCEMQSNVKRHEPIVRINRDGITITSLTVEMEDFNASKIR